MNKISRQHPPSSPVPFPTLVTVHIRPNTSPPPNPTSNTLWQSHKSSLAQGKLQKWMAEIVLSGHQANFKGLDEFMAPPPVVEPFNHEEPIENPAPPLAPMDDTRTMLNARTTTAVMRMSIVDSLNSAAGGNFLDKMPRDCLRIIESKSKVRNSRNKPVVAKVSSSTSTPGISSDVAELKDMVKALLLDKKNQSPAPTPVKAVEESCVTCGGAHSYQTCPATTGNVYRDNIQEYVSQAAAANYNQGNTGYRAPISNQIRPPGFPPAQNNHNVQNQGNNQNRY
ncbi:hypothetical protein Tco_1063349 [Tanacetum coccineum]